MRSNAHHDASEHERLVNPVSGLQTEFAKRVDRMHYNHYSLRVFSMPNAPSWEYDAVWQQPQRIGHQGDSYVPLIGTRGGSHADLPGQPEDLATRAKGPPAMSRPRGYKPPPVDFSVRPRPGAASSSSTPTAAKSATLGLARPYRGATRPARFDTIPEHAPLRSFTDRDLLADMGATPKRPAMPAAAAPRRPPTTADVRPPMPTRPTPILVDPSPERPVPRAKRPRFDDWFSRR